MEKTSQILSFLTGITGLNAAFYGRDGVMTASNELLARPLWLPKDDLKCSENLSIQSDSIGLVYLICPMSRSGYVKLGPFLTSFQDQNRFSRLRDKLSPPLPKDFEIKGFFSLLLHKNKRDINNLGSLLLMSCAHYKPLDSLPGISKETVTASLKSSSARDQRRITGMYEMERQLRQFISRGDSNAILNLMKQPIENTDWLRRLPHNPLRLSKNMGLVLNTVSRLAAERGGLEPHFLHSISEKYAMKIEACSSMESIRETQMTLVLEYCDAVRNFALKNYSGLISKTISHILQDLESNISLESTAALLKTNPSYLSRQFKKETGQTYSEYVREKRIEEAKWLIDHEDLSLSDIATRVGYSDLNYFSRVFRQVSGFSPREYRKNPMAGHFDGIPGES